MTGYRVHSIAYSVNRSSCTQVLLSPEMGSRTVHFDALRREVQLAARFNSERLVQVVFHCLPCPMRCLVQYSPWHGLQQGCSPKAALYTISEIKHWQCW